MAKYTMRQKLLPEDETNLIIDFCKAVSTISNIEESTLFIRDLLTKQEITMLAKRLKIAKLLIEGENYQNISKSLKVSSGTIARINIWLNQSGEGFRLISNKQSDFKTLKKPTWSGIKRKYPMYHWPEILLKEIVYSANKRQKEKLQNIINSVDEKTALLKELDKIIRRNANTSQY